EADAAQQRWFTLSTLAERARATARIAADRARSLAAEVAVHHGTDPDELDRQAERAAAHEDELTAAVEDAAGAARLATEELTAAESALAEVEAEHLKAVRAIADRREGVARLAGKVETLAAPIEATEAALGRIDQERRNRRARVGGGDGGVGPGRGGGRAPQGRPGDRGPAGGGRAARGQGRDARGPDRVHRGGDRQDRPGTRERAVRGRGRGGGVRFRVRPGRRALGGRTHPR